MFDLYFFFLQTGKPKNYGFIEFRFEDVAEIAAKTMDNYLMFDRIVKCQILPPEKIKTNIFRNWNRPFVSSVEKHRLAHNQPKTAKQELRMVQRHLQQIRKMNTFLAENGIEFECVIINRPTDLKAIKSDDDNGKIQSPEISTKKLIHSKKAANSTDTMPIEVIHMIRPKKRLSSSTTTTLLKRKRLMNAKLMKMKASFSVQKTV